MTSPAMMVHDRRNGAQCQDAEHAMAAELGDLPIQRGWSHWLLTAVGQNPLCQRLT
jgi:hypothetical protein